MNEATGSKRQARGRRARTVSAAAGSEEQAAQQEPSGAIQPQLVAAVTEQVLKAIKEQSQENPMGVKRGRERERTRKQKKQRTQSSSGRKIPSFGTTYGSISSQHTSQVPLCLEDTTSELLQAAVSDNTHLSYKTALAVYENYYRETFSSGPKFPFSVDHIMYFVAWLHRKGRSYNTMNTYLAGISYHHKIQGLTDPTQFFVVKKLIKGAQHLSSTPDIRLPITPNILFQLVKALNFTVCGKFNKRLLSAMFTLSFFAFLRVGEITANSTKSRKNLIQFSSLTKCTKQDKHMSLTLQHFKHNDTGRPVCLQISAQNCKTICPVTTMAKYLKLRGKIQGPLFSFDGCTPITQAFYIEALKNALSFIGLNPKQYKSHSFRIGAASHAFQCHIPEDKIRLMGRWNSNAVKRYFRIPVFDSIDISPSIQTV